MTSHLHQLAIQYCTEYEGCCQNHLPYEHLYPRLHPRSLAYLKRFCSLNHFVGTFKIPHPRPMSRCCTLPKSLVIYIPGLLIIACTHIQSHKYKNRIKEVCLDGWRVGKSFHVPQHLKRFLFVVLGFYCAGAGISIDVLI